MSPKPLSCLISKSKKRFNRNTLKLELPEYKYVGYKKSFRYRATNVWNLLPVELREKSYDQFKTNLTEKELNQITFGTLATGKALQEDFIYY